ncbi:MAG: OB-fold nucleic acid binding domain-containing protein [Candidatus Pacearchaeota archaeon]|nr:OB-fold nucleic acid binding domain-containing protein [Candidatus Pacearchaeota archaeon]
MQEEFRKRFTAYKLSIGMLLEGKPIFENGKFKTLIFNNKEIYRVNIIATVIDKFISEEKPYIALTIDDNTGVVRVKAFADDVVLLKNIEIGDTILVIGLLRYFGEELYILPEIVKVLDPKWLLARRLELMEEYKTLYEETKKFERMIKETSKESLREKLLEMIAKAEPQGGISIEQLILMSEEPPEQINREIETLLEEGVIFESKPGFVRIL